MKITTPEISWHARDPIYSVDFQFITGDIQRLATCGTDRFVRIWEVKTDSSGKPNVEFLSSLNRHTRTVNVVRFSPCGQLLASAGDDSAIVIWKLNENAPPPNSIFAEDEEDNKEIWSVVRGLRSHVEDVYDLSWSSCGNYMISGSVDNSAIYWDVKKGVRLGMFPDHKSFVQGVAFDPLNKYLATMSADRCCRVYSIESKNCLHVVNKISLPTTNNNTKSSAAAATTQDQKEEASPRKTYKMFHDDTMKSFFRRLTFSPDGQLLIVPAGCVEHGDQSTENVSYVFARNNLTKPVIQLPGPKTSTLAVRCCPVLFDLRPIARTTPIASASTTSSPSCSADENSTDTPAVTSPETPLWHKYETLFCLPYRMIFAVATEDAVLLYDTQQALPFAYISNIHYHTLSDMSWTGCGRVLAISSTDGFITLITFREGELGTRHVHQAVTLSSRQQIRDQEEQRLQERDKKRKQKEEARKQTSSEPNTKMEQDENPEESGESKQDSEEKMETENHGLSSSQPKTPSHNSQEEGSKKPARRIQITTLCSSPKTPSGNVLTNCENSPKVVAPTSSQQNGEVSQSPKTPRRIGVTTLKAYSSPASSSSPSLTTQPATPTSSKKRVQLTTLKTYTQDKPVDSPTAPDSADSDLHLVLETTCDSTPLLPSSDTPNASHPLDTPMDAIKPPTTELINTPTSSSKKAPRRVNITTISASQ